MPALAKSERIKALFILDSEGQRICAKFYAGNFPTNTDQENLEKMLPKSAEPGSEGDFLTQIIMPNVLFLQRIF